MSKNDANKDGTVPNIKPLDQGSSRYKDVVLPVYEFP